MTTYYEIKEDDSREEIEDVQETTRITSSDSYDDNWELVKYTSELRDSKGRFFAFVDFYGEEGSIKYCPHCKEYGILNKLQPRILKKDEPIPPDYDEFIQCYSCGNIVPIYESHHESEIKDSLETLDNPFEGNASHFETTKKRKYKDRRSNKYLDDDPDIAAEQKRYGSDNVRIIQ